MTRTAFTSLCMLLFSCSGAIRLSDSEESKLDPAVRRLLAQEVVVETDYDVKVRPDGTKEYGLVVRSGNVDEIKNAGIVVSSVFGDVVVVRVTLEELKTLVGLPSVRSVQNGSKNHLH